MIEIYNYSIVLAITLIIDGLWLFISHQIYINMYKRLLGRVSKFDLVGAVFAYLILALGTTVFIVEPALKNNWSWYHIITKSMILGLVVYGVYNMTNRATFGEEWDWNIALMDMAWGIIGTSLISIASVYVL
jgi:uncharacterized membrane protein